MEDPEIIRLNIEHYRHLLKLDLSEQQRRTVTRLLAESEQGLAEASSSENV